MTTADKPTPSIWVRSGPTLKFFFIGFMILLLCIPLGMVQNLVLDRQSYYLTVIDNITQTWGKSQTLVGPMLTVPYQYTTVDANKKTSVLTDYVHVLPSRLSLKSTLKPEIRYRGIYEAVVYDSQSQVEGAFDLNEVPKALADIAYEKPTILWSNAQITLGVNDIKGIQNQPALTWNHAPLPFEPGVMGQPMIKWGMHRKVDLTGLVSKQVPFSFDLALNGSQSFMVLPLAKETVVAMHSSWATPSFVGAYLPVNRTVNDTGFDATWKTSYFSTSLPVAWRERQQPEGFYEQWQATGMGVELIQAINPYQESDRAVKYGILILSLTFITYYLFEVVLKQRLHIIQYGFIGMALCIFYTLLLSLSEFMGFGWAYWLASAMTMGLITAYTYGFSRERKLRLSAIVSAMLCGLFLYLYMLLRMEDYSLLFGAVGLFLILGFIMYVTRKIDWFNAYQAPEPIQQGS